MRARLLWWCLLTMLPGNPTAAQDMDMIAVARSYSAHYFMRTVCPRYMVVNEPLAVKTNEAFLMLGNKVFGEQAMRPAVISEVERRRNEIAATGEKQWCSYQRSAMIEAGLPELFR